MNTGRKISLKLQFDDLNAFVHVIVDGKTVYTAHTVRRALNFAVMDGHITVEEKQKLEGMIGQTYEDYD